MSGGLLSFTRAVILLWKATKFARHDFPSVKPWWLLPIIFFTYFFLLHNSVLAFPSPVWMNLCTCRVRYSKWRWEIHVFDKELDTKLLKSQSAQHIFTNACSGCVLGWALDMVGKQRLPWGDQTFPQRCLWASRHLVGYSLTIKACGYFLICKGLVGGVVGTAGIANLFPVLSHRSWE